MAEIFQEKNLVNFQAQLENIVKILPPVVQNYLDVIILVDAQERILYLNHPPPDSPPGGLIGKNVIDDYLSPGDIQSARGALRQVFQAGESTQLGLVSRGVLPDSASWYSGQIFPVKDGGLVSAALFILRNVTDAQNARQEMERFFDLSPELLCIASPKGFFKKVNPAFVHVLGYSRDALLSRPLWEFIHPEDREPTMREVERQLRGGTTLNFINRYATVEGDYRWLSWKALQDPQTGLLYAAAEDVTEKRGLEADVAAMKILIAARKKAETAALANEARYRALLDAMMEGFWLVDDQGIIQEVNQTYLSMTGYSKEELIGMSVSIVDAVHTPEDVRERISMLLREGSARFETRHRKKDGKIIEVEISANHKVMEEGAFVCLIRDLSEKRILQQAQKLEAVGQLAGGMAHEFNNVLQGILGFASLLEASSTLGSQEKDYADHVLKGARRGADLVRRILAFGRKADHEKRPVSVCQALGDAAKMLSRTLPATMEIRQVCPEETGMIMADPTQLAQALTNLIINGAHAMSGAGIIALRAVNCSPAAGGSAEKKNSACSLCPRRQSAAELVCISVEDSGHGISQDHRRQIFEPFFTTKEPGAGTGLGLAVTYGIVRENDGHIHFLSELGKGTVFYLSFPRVASKKLLEIQAEPGETRGFGERILFVDDEESITTLAKIYLEQTGYRVDVFNDHAKALEAFASAPGAYDLVITDQTMKRSTGVELAGMMKQIRRGVRIILITGYNRKLTMEQALKAGITRVLSKPIAPKELSLAIRQTLEARE